MANQRQSRQEIKQGLNVQKCEFNHQLEALKILNSAIEDVEKGYVLVAIEKLNLFLKDSDTKLTENTENKVRALFKTLHIAETTDWFDTVRKKLRKNDAVPKIKRNIAEKLSRISFIMINYGITLEDFGSNKEEWDEFLKSTTGLFDTNLFNFAKKS